MSLSRLDKFGTKFDKWAKGNKVDAKPSWKIVQLLSNQLGIKMNYHMAEDIFEEMSKSINEFKHLDYDKIGESGVQLKIKVNELV